MQTTTARRIYVFAIYWGQKQFLNDGFTVDVARLFDDPLRDKLQFDKIEMLAVCRNL